MDKIIISDTSCLIALDRINNLHILRETFDNIITTKEIEEEFGRKLPDWIQIQKARDENKKSELESIVDKGEASAIALALETQNCILIIDEKKGRELARKLKVQIIGTLKAILLAKQKGVIPSVKPLIDQLMKTNFRLDKKVITEILKEAAEE